MSLDPNKNLGTAITLLIPAEIESDFWKIIEEAGFEKNGQGVVDFIMGGEMEDEIEISESPFAELAAHWIKRNPDKVEALQKKGLDVFQTLKSRFKRD